jgi:hypothetical protein
MPNPSIKDERVYRKLRQQGESKDKAARIANQAAREGRSRVGARGGRSGSYDSWSKRDLYQRAKEIGIEGRSSMSKDELITPCATTEPARPGRPGTTLVDRASQPVPRGRQLPPGWGQGRFLPEIAALVPLGAARTPPVPPSPAP